MDFESYCGMCNEHVKAMLTHMAFEHGLIKRVLRHIDGELVEKSAGWENVIPIDDDSFGRSF